jgi:adenosine deaminase
MLMLTKHDELFNFEQIKKMAYDSVKASFIPESEKLKCLNELTRRISLVEQCCADAKQQFNI